jgi:hypothetical protein
VFAPDEWFTHTVRKTVGHPTWVIWIAIHLQSTVVSVARKKRDVLAGPSPWSIRICNWMHLTGFLNSAFES